jgi:hypothetical protein
MTTVNKKGDPIDLFPKGDSAYVLAVDGGYTGTLPEFEQDLIAGTQAGVNEAARLIAEGLRVTAESGRVTAEGLRVLAEQARVTAENLRILAESGRDDAEDLRLSAESARAIAEGLRVLAEQARATAEGLRVTAEGLRVTAEQGRSTAEGLRVIAEQGRVTAEGLRVTAEQGRVTAEELRVTAEGLRITAEDGRVTAEGLRVLAETARAAAEAARVAGGAVIQTQIKQVPGTSTSDLMSQKSVSAITESEAIELLRLHNPALSFQGFANTATSTPGSHTANNAWVVVESGTIFGLASCVKGQIIYSNGSAYLVEYIEIKDLKYYQSNFITTGNNLFNTATATLSAYVASYNGTIITGQANWWCSDYVRVKPSTQYRAGNNVRDRAYYDINKKFISGASDVVNTLTTPAGCYYIRFSQNGTGTSVQPAACMFNEGASALPLEAYRMRFVYGDGLKPTDEVRVVTLETLAANFTPISNEFNLTVLYDSIADVIAATSKTTMTWSDISGIGANYSKSGLSFNAIRLAAAKRGTVADARKWKYCQVYVKNAKEDTTFVAKSPVIWVDPTLAEIGPIVCPLMDSTLANYVTLTDASFSGSTYFVAMVWYNADLSYAYGGTTYGTMSNFAGTSFYSTTNANWVVNSGNPSIALEHVTVTNPSTYKNLKRLDDRIIALENTRGDEEVEIVLPDVINAIVGDTLQLFYRGIIKAVNPYRYDIVINCTKGAWFPRYFEYTPVIGDVGTVTFTVKVKDSAGNLIASKAVSLVTKNAVQSPAANKNVLVLGDSLTAAGSYPIEASRRLIGTGGTPAGKAFTNIAFAGRKPYGSIYGEGNSGWSWANYLTVGRKAFTIAITAPSVMPTIGAVYADSNSKQYTMWWDYSTTSLKFLVNDTTSTPPASGTLTKISGTGDATITYSAIVQSSGNPFWNDSTAQLDVPSYVTKWMAGAVDVVYVLLTWNAVTGNKTDFTAFTDYARTLFNHINANFAACKIKIMGLQVPDLKGGNRIDGAPAENTYTDSYGLVVTAMNMNKAYQALAKEAGLSSFVEYVDVASQFDSEYNMPYAAKAVNARLAIVTEPIGTNDVHPSTEGYYQIADVVYRNFVANFCQ